MTTPILKVLRAKEILADPFADEATLSEREREIARLVARGEGIKQISKELGIAQSTVKTHMGNIHIKLGASPRELRRRMIADLERTLD